MYICGGYSSHSTCVEVGGKFVGISSWCLPCGFWVSNSGCSVGQKALSTEALCKHTLPPFSFLCTGDRAQDYVCVLVLCSTMELYPSPVSSVISALVRFQTFSFRKPTMKKSTRSQLGNGKFCALSCFEDFLVWLWGRRANKEEGTNTWDLSPNIRKTSQSVV